MDAVEYFKTKKRMTKASEENIHCGLMCKNCPLSSQNNGTGDACSQFETLHPEKAVASIEQWGNEHPQKTYLSDFMEKYPKAEIGVNGIPVSICPYHLGYAKEPPADGCGLLEECLQCWNTPMEDDA